VQAMNRRRLLLIISGIILVLPLILVFFFIALPIIELECNKSKFRGVMKNLNQTETKNGLRALFNKDYNYTELLEWEHERLVYTNEDFERYSDPFRIIEYGKGRCEEFSILYVALCLAHGYQSRLVVDMYGDHVWAEIKLQGK